MTPPQITGRSLSRFVLACEGRTEKSFAAFLAGDGGRETLAVFRIHTRAQLHLMYFPLEEKHGIYVLLVRIPLEEGLVLLYIVPRPFEAHKRMGRLITDMLIGIDSRHRIVSFSEQLLWLAGYTERKLFGMPIEKLFLPGQYRSAKAGELKSLRRMKRAAGKPAVWECVYETDFQEPGWEKDWILDRHFRSRVTRSGLRVTSYEPTTFMTFRTPLLDGTTDLRMEMEFEGENVFSFYNGRAASQDSRVVTPDHTGYTAGLVFNSDTGEVTPDLRRECRRIVFLEPVPASQGPSSVATEKIGGVLRVFYQGHLVTEYADPYCGRLSREMHAGLIISGFPTRLMKVRILRKPAALESAVGYRRFDLVFHKRPEAVYEAEFFEYALGKAEHTDIVLHEVTDLRKSQQAVDQLLDQKEASLERIREELRIAGTVVEQLLPQDMPAIQGVRFAYHYKPCESVGGDLFDVVAAGPDKAILFLYDVSGHGVSAALISVMTRTLFKKAFDPDEPILPQLEKINSELRRYFQSHFVSYFCGILDAGKRRLRYVGGGLPYPVVLGGGRLVLLDSQGTPLALQQELHASEKTATFEPGDRFLLFTDGLYEAFNAEDEIYGRKRLMEFANTHAALGIDALVERLVGEHHRHLDGMPATDDVTLLGIEFARETDEPVRIP